ncbi:hypothetical protein K443DRAFT_530894 [Laccaria amethystina LaAM-08-1]|uniref:Uncharacterized protein n=1 Tax=Laccaria amethystina LaAM-08-1 TaxID=1095629 RepID=A0A0C9XUL6_9AGAR|nr:hypothetical protein K443DRAFT_530894 [Laccaria amethystina LaAM-08-1]
MSPRSLSLSSTRSLNCLGRGTFLSPTAFQLFHCRVVSQNRVISSLGNVCRAELVLRSARLGFYSATGTLSWPRSRTVYFRAHCSVLQFWQTSLHYLLHVQ